MPMTRVKNEKKVRRRGRVYYYHQLTGERLPDEREARLIRLMEINQEIAARPAKPEGPPPGSFIDVIRQYKDSSDFQRLAPKTRYEYGRHLDAIEKVWAKASVAAVQRKHVLAMRDKLQGTPREANYRLMVMGRLMRFAIDRGFRTDQPVKEIRKLKEGEGYQAWPDWLYDAVLADPETPKEVADALRLLRWTGQRPQDVVAMTWAHVDRESGWIALTQQKTGSRVWVPLHPRLVEVLDGIPRRAAVIVTRQSGRPWTVNYLARAVREAVTRQGQQGRGFTPHGLRHSAGDALAEAGASSKQIGAILGHKTLSMVQRYTESADQRKLASAAVWHLHGEVRK